MIVEEYQSKMLNAGKAPATSNRHLANLKHMFTKAVEWEMVEEEAREPVRRVKLLQENNRRLRYLSREECKALLGACSPHLRPIVVTALNTGMRKEEILSHGNNSLGPQRPYDDTPIFPPRPGPYPERVDDPGCGSHRGPT
jgi:integrase